MVGARCGNRDRFVVAGSFDFAGRSPGSVRRKAAEVPEMATAECYSHTHTTEKLPSRDLAAYSSKGAATFAYHLIAFLIGFGPSFQAQRIGWYARSGQSQISTIGDLVQI